jgi:hypothetical protein
MMGSGWAWKFDERWLCCLIAPFRLIRPTRQQRWVL